MSQKTPIKVIKRDERNRQENKDASKKTARPSAQETVRDMASTVANWVSELQQKRRTETTRAFNSLFPESPRPNEA
jgi:dsDNA-specific endonuclease/ATPase MutS2